MKDNRKIAALFFAFICLVYFLAASGHIGGDGLWVYCAVESVVQDGDLNISNMKETIDIPELQNSYKDIYSIVKDLHAKGHSKIYVQYGIGQIVLEAPFYVIGHVAAFILPFFPHDYFTIFSVSLLNIVLVALSSIYLFLTLLLLYGARRQAYWITLIFSFGTYIFVYAVKSGLSDPTLALCLIGAVYHLIHFRSTANKKDLFFSGGWFGLGLLVKFYFLIVFPFLAGYLLYVLWDSSKSLPLMVKNAIWYACPIVISGVIFALYNYARFGNIFETGYNAYGSAAYGVEQSIFDGSVLFSLGRAYGLLFSPGKGILFFAPILFLCLSGLIIDWHKHRLEMLLILLLCGAVFAFFSANILWHGEWSWGPRYLLTILPLLIIPAGAFLTTVSESKSHIYLCSFFVAGILIQLPAVAMNTSNFIRFTNESQIYGYRIFLPQYSPIAGNYILLYSGLSRIITGKSFSYPVDYYQTGEVRQYNLDGIYSIRNAVNLAQYDSFDLWIATLWRQSNGKLILRFGAIIVYSFLLIIAARLHKKLKMHIV